MTAIAQAKSTIQVEETRSGAAPSEAVLQKIGGSINWLNANAGTQLGDIIPSGLTQTQFQSLRGNNWVLMNGQSITGSDFAVLTGITTLPNMPDGFSLIESGNVSMLGTSTGDVKAHTHTINLHEPGTLGATSRIVYNLGAAEVNSTQDTLSTGGTNNLPAGVKVNHFIKINNNPT